MTSPTRPASEQEAARRRSARFISEPGLRISALSIEHWGQPRAVDIVGLSPAFVDVLNKLEKVARYREPVLFTGESGVGKEQLAQSVYLLSAPKGRPYVSVSCPQYQEGNLTVSELFGHTRGSFTGAVADRRGAFEEADGGVLFLDEIGDLHPSAQAMLLRTLSTGEFRPLGGTKSRTADVRVVSATNRPLNRLVLSNEFRYDLFFRLARFQLPVPPLRERGDDWLLLVEYCLLDLAEKYGVAKRLSASSLKLLASYAWPGNVRELLNLVTTGYAMADGDVIEPCDFTSLLESHDGEPSAPEKLYDRVAQGRAEFWTDVYGQFMERELNRAQMRAFIKHGLREAEGNYRRLLDFLNLPASDYQRFMDFLRHHDVKPRPTGTVRSSELLSD
jgi:transcriptional regulator with GAF, ATPase, and Fis domain